MAGYGFAFKLLGKKREKWHARRKKPSEACCFWARFPRQSKLSHYLLSSYIPSTFYCCSILNSPTSAGGVGCLQVKLLQVSGIGSGDRGFDVKQIPWIYCPTVTNTIYETLQISKFCAPRHYRNLHLTKFVKQWSRKNKVVYIYPTYLIPLWNVDCLLLSRWIAAWQAWLPSSSAWGPCTRHSQMWPWLRSPTLTR